MAFFFLQQATRAMRAHATNHDQDVSQSRYACILDTALAVGIVFLNQTFISLRAFTVAYHDTIHNKTGHIARFLSLPNVGLQNLKIIFMCKFHVG